MGATSRQAFVGVGSNLGNRLRTMRGAFDALNVQPGTHRLVSSSIFETLPVGLTEQPLFLNAVFGVETSERPEALLAVLLDIEQRFGRIRRDRWGPRTLDLDLLQYEGERCCSETLQLPHPRMFERTFVTVPLRDVLQNRIFQVAAWDTLRTSLARIVDHEPMCRLVSPPFVSGPRKLRPNAPC